jgi:hypothetical protein
MTWDGCANWNEAQDLIAYVSGITPTIVTGSTATSKYLNKENYGTDFKHCWKYRENDKHYISFFLCNSFSYPASPTGGNNILIDDIEVESFDKNFNPNAHGVLYIGFQTGSTITDYNLYINRHIYNMQIGVNELNNMGLTMQTYNMPYTSFTSTRDAYIRVTATNSQVYPPCYKSYTYALETYDYKNMDRFMVSYKTKNGGFNTIPFNFYSIKSNKTSKETFNKPLAVNSTTYTYNHLNRQIEVFKNQKQGSLTLTTDFLTSPYQIQEIDQLLSSPELYIYDDNNDVLIPVNVDDSEYEELNNKEDYTIYYKIKFNKAFLENSIK